MENQLKQSGNLQEKKKRGRKPKIKPDEIIQKVLKKRGRKPKIRTEEEMKPKIPKKRGRKPKDKYGIIPQNSQNINEFNIVEENIILHLPIKSDSIIDNEFTDKVLLEYNPIISEPQPFTKSFDNSKSDMSPYPFKNRLNTTQSHINNEDIDESNIILDNINNDSMGSDYHNDDCMYHSKEVNMIFYNKCENNGCYDNERHDNESHDNECHDNECHDNECHDNECHDNECHDNECHENECHDNECRDNECHDNECQDNECQDNECQDNECNDNDCIDTEILENKCQDNGCKNDKNFYVDLKQKNTNIEDMYISYSGANKINYTPIIKKLDNYKNMAKDIGKNNVTIDFKNTNLNKSQMSSTTINCFWCCHPFNKSTPCAIPYNKINNVYYVYGSFCSPECAAAFNFDNSEDTSEIWNRYSLLNLLYKSIYNGNKIKLAPPRYVLKTFGGPLNINEFKKFNYNSKKQLHINMPPVISIIHNIEENNIEMSNSEKKKFIPLDELRVKNADDSLRLKRSKPLSSNQKLTLVDCMRLKYV